MSRLKDDMTLFECERNLFPSSSALSCTCLTSASSYAGNHDLGWMASVVVNGVKFGDWLFGSSPELGLTRPYPDPLPHSFGGPTYVLHVVMALCAYIYEKLILVLHFRPP